LAGTVAAEDLQLQENPIRRAEGALDESSIAALARVASESHEVVERELRAENATLKAQALRYQTAIDNILQGVCFFDGENFDGEDRLILSNRRFAEIFRLAPEQIRPGMTLCEIVDLRIAAGTWATAADDYLSFCVSSHSGKEAIVWTAELRDGRLIQMRRQPMPGGGCVVSYEDITEVKAERAAADERLSLQTLIDRLPDNLWVKDVNSRFVIANQATADRIGVPGPADLMGKTDLELLPPELAQKFFADEQQIVRTGQPMIDMEEFSWGLKQQISTTKVPLRNDRGEIFGVAGVSRDITERKLADTLRDGQGQILEMIAGNAPLEDVLDRLVRLVESQLTGIFGSILLVDEDGTRLRNGAAPNLPEAYVKAIDGAPIGPNAGPSGRAAYRREPVIVADAQTDPLLTDYKDLAAANGLRSCWSTPILSHDGEARGVFAMYSRSACEPSPVEMRLVDIATHMAGIAIERKLAEDRIRFMANHDALTGLPNRTLLNDRLSQAVLYAQRYDRWATVAFVDLDNFKTINDSLGHNAGDELLKAVAKRMVGCVRATDTVARLGGDEFVILLLDQPKSAEIISATVRKISAAVAEPICLEGHELRVTSSMGIANYPDDGTDAETLLASADAAMYRAKEMGRDNFQFYTPELNAKVHEKFLLHEEMRNAVARSEFVLVYQPQVDLRTGRIFAVEALIRWKHPTWGVLSPIKFIPMAEETGLIVPIGDWVLHEACRQNKAWQDAGLPPMTVCVNVSARQFRDKSLSSRVVSALQDSGLDAKYLELEMTESMIMLDVELAVTTMKELQELGVHLSIDDFGTGYSSLSALKNFPVSRLKIDKTFINDLTTNDNDTAVASAVISLGQKLNLRVIAEGVETDDQLAFLRENNCDEMQGYHFSRPIPAQEIEKLLKTQAQPDQSASR
jgi:diguanylate cyclase (GGDEF)-like protein/PAS domain S-box-containing protein